MSEAAAPGGLGLPIGPARLLSDERLVRRATSGDERAFAAIFRRYHQDLYRYCVAILGDSEDAEDALQNAMVKVMRALPGERRQIRLKPWLYRIAHNEAIEVLRRRVPAERIDPELAATAPGPSEEAEQRARMRRLVADVAELPERQRGALVMRELAGLEFDEIAAALDASPAVARQTLYEARLSLRQMEEGRELSCDEVMRALSDADGRVSRRRDLRAHLRECAACREFAGEMRGRRADFAAIAPLPALAAAGILQGVLGATGSGGTAAAGGAGGAAVGKALGGSALGGSVVAKSAVTVAVVAAVGAGVADRGGLVDVGLPGGGAGDTPADVRPESTPAGPAGVTPGSAAEADAGAAEGTPGGGAAAAKPKHATGQGPSAGGGSGQQGTAQAPGEVPPVSTAPGASGAHRQDSGRRGNPPSAADHGQGTAASHKGGASAPGQQGGGPSPPKKGQGSGAGHGNSGGQGSAAAANAAPKEPGANSPQAQPPPVPEPPPDPSAPPGPESAGGGKPAPPPETPAGSNSAPADLG